MKETVKQYICIDKMYEAVLKILKNSRNGMTQDWSRGFMEDNYPDDELEDRAQVMAEQFNDDMRKYLNETDHCLPGNFNNIEYDYPLHIKGECEYDYDLVYAMIARLNAGEQSEQTNADREWLVDWFFEIFGTFGIAYNFECEISEMLYEYEKKMEAA